VLSPVGKDAVKLRCVAGAGEMWVSGTRDRIRIGDRSDKDQPKKFHECTVTLMHKLLKIIATFLKFPHPIAIREMAFGDIHREFRPSDSENMETSRVIRKSLVCVN
jgi:hypothetical protein